MEPDKIQTRTSFAAGSKRARRLRVGDLFRLSLRVFRTKPMRTFLTALGMSLGVGIVLFLISLGYGLQYLLVGRLVTTEDSLITVEAYYPSESNVFVTGSDIEKIKTYPEYGEISPVAEFPAELIIDPGEANQLSGFMLARVVSSNYGRLSGIAPDLKVKNENPETPGVVVSNAALKTIGLPADETSLGKKIKLRIYYPAESDLKSEVRPVETAGLISISGIITDESQPPFVIAPREILGSDAEPPYYQDVFVKAKDINAVDGLRNRMISGGMLVSSRVDMVNQVKKIMSILTIILGVFGITALIVSAIGMFNTMIISFLERVFEVGIMKAIGASNHDIRNLFLMESLMMGILGGVGGILLGIGMGDLANFGINLLAKSFGGKPITLFLLPWWFMALILGISSIIGVLSGFWPARRAMKVSPQEAFVRK